MARTEDVFVPMPDGVRLASTLFLPDGGGPWPPLLEALPYRKDDLTASYREEYRRFADEFGYAVCRLDIRGTGSSEGDPGRRPSRGRPSSHRRGGRRASTNPDAATSARR